MPGSIAVIKNVTYTSVHGTHRLLSGLAMYLRIPEWYFGTGKYANVVPISKIMINIIAVRAIIVLFTIIVLYYLLNNK